MHRFTLRYKDRRGVRHQQFTAPSTELGIAKAVEFLNHRPTIRTADLSEANGQPLLPAFVRWW